MNNERRGPLSWEHVRYFEEHGMYELAVIARRYVLRNEERERKHQRRWYRRLWRAIR